MKQQDEYIAREAFTFPLFCLVCIAFNIYCGIADGWPGGVIIGTPFFGIVVFDCQSSRSQNRYLTGIVMIAALAIMLFALISCNNRHDLTDNYSVFTYGEGVYGESEQDYPIFTSKLGYAGEPKYIPNVQQIWWNDTVIIIEQNNDLWWIIAAVDKELTAGDTFQGPLSRQQKDSIIAEGKMNPDKMKHSNYE